MQVDDIYIEQDSCVSGKYNITISDSKEKMDELREALKIVQKYQKSALNAYRGKFKHQATEADWCEFHYAIKTDKVIVTIRNGMAG